MAAKAAKWTAARPTIAVGADGTLTATLPLSDNGTLAATLTFTITADRALELVVTNAPGAAGLSGFSAWSTS